MLKEMKELGDYVIKEKFDDPMNANLSISKLEKDLDDGKGDIISILFDYKNNSVDYVGIETEPYSFKKALKSIYRWGSSSGGDYSPTVRASTKVEKFVDRLFRRYYEKYSEENDLVSEVKQCFEDSYDVILNDIEKKYKKLDNCIFLTTKISKNGSKPKFPSEYDEFMDLLEKLIEKEFSVKYGCISKGESRCSICNNKKNVYGFSFPFVFGTRDKEGYSSNLSRRNAWKSFPLCKDCSYSLLATKNFLNGRSISIKIGDGTKYFYFPVFYKDFERRDNIYKEFVKGGMNISSFSGLYSDKKMALNMIFYRQKSGKVEIRKFMENVDASWVDNLKNVRNEIEGFKLFGENINKKITGEKGNFSVISKSKNVVESILYLFNDMNDFDRNKFLDLMSCVYQKKYIDRNVLFGIYSGNIKIIFRNDWDLSRYIMKSLFYFIFFSNIGLLKNSVEVDGVNMNDDMSVEDFIEEFSFAFDSEEKIAVCLLGMLANKIMSYQYATRGSKPFKSKLFGLRLDLDKIKSIFVDIEDKTMQYDDFNPVNLKRKVSEYMLKAENNGWNISRDEITYFFTLGKVFERLF